MGLAACTTPPPARPPPTEPVGSIPSVAPAPAPGPIVYSVARREAWSDVKRIARLLAHVPAEECPGLSGLAADVERWQRRIEIEATPRLDDLDARALVTTNVNFWRAHLELAPSDPLAILFAALVHLSAGESGTANELLRLLRAGPLLPETIDRVINLHLFRSGEPPAPELERIVGANVLGPAEKVARLEALRREQPDRAVVAHLLIIARRLEAGLPSDPVADSGAPEVLRAVMEASQEEVRLMRRTWPIGSLPYEMEEATRQATIRTWPTWLQTMQPRSGLGIADFEALATLFSRGGLPEQALLARRLMTATRSFGSPTDLAFGKPELARLLGPAAGPLLEAWERGEIRQLAFFGPELPPAGDRYRPLHPVFAETLERVRRSASYALEMPIDDPQRMAAAYATRAGVLRELGRWDEAMADLQRHIALNGEGRRATWLSFHLALDRLDLPAATAALARMGALAPEERATLREQAMLRAAAGEWQQAGAALARLAELESEEEAAGFSALHAFAAYRMNGYEAPPEIWRIRQRIDPASWIGQLLAALADPPRADDLLRHAANGATELDRVGRRCEALFVLATLAPAGSDTAKVHLENCVRTGVADFVEYQLARILLRQLDPEQWDERLRPAVPPGPGPDAPSPPPPRKFDDARPRRVVPA